MKFLKSPLVRRWLCSRKLNNFTIKVKKDRKEGYETKQFIDHKALVVEAGNGGDGAIALLREFANEFGGPCGGNGGNGGHVIFQGCSQIADLSGIPSVIKGSDGAKGEGKSCDGASAKHTIIKVPVGTLINCCNSNQQLADIAFDEQQYIAVRGGAGGKGNRFFYSEEHVAPTLAERGGHGDKLKIFLEVKLLADIGLVGVPNAGKSTLLRSLTRARPKVAPYAFTTLRPYIGSIDFNDDIMKRVTICDIPGIVQDSHKNLGLGLEFLRHIERCRALAFVLDLSDCPCDQYSVLLEELRIYRPLLLTLPRILICNKMDLPNTRESYEELRKYAVSIEPKSRNDIDIIAISGKDSVNLTRLVNLLYSIKQKCISTE